MAFGSLVGKGHVKVLSEISTYADPGPASWPKEGPEWRSGSAAAGAADASSGVRSQSPATGHGGKTVLCWFFQLFNSLFYCGGTIYTNVGVHSF